MSDQETFWSEPEPIRHVGVGKRLNSVDLVEGVCGISDYGYFFDTEQNKHVDIHLYATRNRCKTLNDLNVDAYNLKPQLLVLSCRYPKYFVYIAGTSALLCGAIGIFAMGLRNRK